MLSWSAVDRGVWIQTGNHGETHRRWTPGVRPPPDAGPVLDHDQTVAKISLVSKHGGQEEERATPIHRCGLFLNNCRPTIEKHRNQMKLYLITTPASIARCAVYAPITRTRQSPPAAFA
jgi:hypothetical protein